MIDTAAVSDLMRDAVGLVIKLGGPMLVLSMVVGVLIAIFQAATQINEQTMTFVPKFLSILVVMGLLGTSMLSTLQEFFQHMLTLIIGS